MAKAYLLTSASTELAEETDRETLLYMGGVLSSLQAAKDAAQDEENDLHEMVADEDDHSEPPALIWEFNLDDGRNTWFAEGAHYEQAYLIREYEV